VPDRTAIVTGGARGIGAAIALRLARSRYNVVVCDLDEEQARTTAGRIAQECGPGAALGLGADVTDEQQVQQMVERTLENFGCVHTLVNNAGILFPTRLHNIALDEWRRVIEVNLTGTFICSLAVIPHMKVAGRGRIINMSSSAGKSVSTIGGAHYTAAKAGVLGLTRAMAKELAADGILVNAVCPGLITTEMVLGSISAAEIDRYASSFPANRLGSPDEVAEIVQFLSESGSYVTGASIDVNGGDLMV
jgi:3-oxoacyl-[acyl-carrier protein] reductase